MTTLLNESKIVRKYAFLDTDSIIFLAPRDVALPFVEGSSLGQMKEEHPNHDVISFYR